MNYVRLFAIFNRSLPCEGLAERLAVAIVDYCSRYDDISGSTIMDLFQSLCTKEDKEFYMDVRAFIAQLGLPINNTINPYPCILGC